MSYRRPPMELVVVVPDGPPVPLPAGWRIVGRMGAWWLVERPVPGADEGAPKPDAVSRDTAPG